MLPAVITNIHQAFQEIKHMAIDTWQEECCWAARRAMKGPGKRCSILSLLFSLQKSHPPSPSSPQGVNCESQCVRSDSKTKPITIPTDISIEDRRKKLWRYLLECLSNNILRNDFPLSFQDSGQSI